MLYLCFRRVLQPIGILSPSTAEALADRYACEISDLDCSSVARDE